MAYKEQHMTLRNPLSFWNYFTGEERFLFFDPYNERLVMGAKRLQSLTASDPVEDYNYVFCPRTFFETATDEKWLNLGNENIVYQYYYVVDNNGSRMEYTGDPVRIQDGERQSIRHDYAIKKDNEFEKWKAVFDKLMDPVHRGEVNKVVASRQVEVDLQEEANIESILHRLMQHNENSFIFAYHKDNKTFLGATPEVLVQKVGEQVLSFALAGTMKYNIENSSEILLTDPKNLMEHRIVVDSIYHKFLKLSHEVTKGDTHVMELRNIAHLKTTLAAKADCHTLFDWVNALHPTPALGGYPAEKALNLIRKYEDYDRGMYAAPLGLIDGKGNGVFVVGIRSALIRGRKVYCYAGCGLVKDSDCQQEYEETKVKLKTILESL